MSKLKQLKEERKAKFDALDALTAKRETEKRDFTPEEVTQFDTIEREVEELASKIDLEERHEKLMLRKAAAVAGTATQTEGLSEREDKDLSKYSIRKVMLAATEGRALEGLEAEMHQEGIAELQRAGASPEGGKVIPELVLGRMFAKRNQTVTGGANGDQGGLTVETSVTGYEAVLRERSLLLQLGARYLPGLVGNFDIPVENSVYRPSFKSENADSDKSSATYKKVSFSPKRLAGHMDVSRQLLIQSSVAIESMLRNQLVQGHAEALDQAGFNGAGISNEPLGILNDSAIAVHALGTNGGALTQAALDELDVILRDLKQYGATAIITNARVRKFLRNLKLDAGSGLFVWDRQTNTIDGKAAYDTTHVPSDITKGTGENLSALIEGVYSDAWYGQWGGTEILTDPYTQATKGMVRMVTNQYADFHVVRKDSFAVIKDISI